MWDWWVDAAPMAVGEWDEEERLGRGVFRREWVPREIWEESDLGSTGKKER